MRSRRALPMPLSPVSATGRSRGKWAWLPECCDGCRAGCSTGSPRGASRSRAPPRAAETQHGGPVTVAANPEMTYVDAIGQSHVPAGGDARIVSLVPSITELLFDLGVGNRVVGRTGFCIHPRS